MSHRITHSQYHCTMAHSKSPHHTWSLHRSTSFLFYDDTSLHFNSLIPLTLNQELRTNFPQLPSAENSTIPNQRSKLCYNQRFSRPVYLGIKHPSGAYDEIFISVRQLHACWCGALSQTRGRVCRLPDSVSSNSSLVSMYNLHVTSYKIYVYTTYARPLSVQTQYSRSCPIISSSCYNSSLVTSTVVCLTSAKFKPLSCVAVRLVQCCEHNYPEYYQSRVI
jgi:hypothetical protein